MLMATPGNTTEDAAVTGAMDTRLRRLGLRPGYQVMILGGYGVRNVGDEAILAGLLHELPARVNVRVVSRSPEDTTRLHGVSAVPPWKAALRLNRADTLIVGGGGIFSGHMGIMGQLIPLFCLLARIRKIEVAFHGVGVYPSAPAWVQRAIHLLAPHLASLTVRDRVSLRTLQSWGINNLEQMPDLSSFMPVGRPERAAELFHSTGLTPGVPTVALCLTAADRRMEERVTEVMLGAVEAMPEVQFCFVPMGQHPRVAHHNDLLLAQRIAVRAPRVSILRGWHHPAEVLALFDYFDAAVCMRYHSLLFARRAGAGVVPVPYAEKCDSWLEEAGVPAAPLTVQGIVRRLEKEISCRRRSGGRIEITG